jgi:RNA polymerase sigma-70 factor (ECF subfamily)
MDASKETHATHELVERAKAGDEDAYDRLFDRVADRLLLYTRVRMGKSLRRHADPLDVVQESYLEAHRSFGGFEAHESDSFTRWIFRVVDNRIRDLAKHYGSKKRSPLGGLVHDSQALRQLRQDHAGPLTSVERRERHERLVNAMDELEPEEREALLLQYFRRLTLAEISVSLGRSQATISRLLGRARLRLGMALAPHDDA